MRLAAALLFLLGAAGCRSGAKSSGTCEGAVGATSITGALATSSAYNVDWSDGSKPVAVLLDCGGKLVLTLDMAGLPSAGEHTWTLPSNAPACASLRDSADAGVIPPECLPKDAASWTLAEPKQRPVLKTGTLVARKDEERLRGEAQLHFADGTTATVRFSLEHGEVPDLDGRTSPRISPIPGRISF